MRGITEARQRHLAIFSLCGMIFRVIVNVFNLSVWATVFHWQTQFDSRQKGNTEKIIGSIFVCVFACFRLHNISLIAGIIDIVNRMS